MLWLFIPACKHGLKHDLSSFPSTISLSLVPWNPQQLFFFPPSQQFHIIFIFFQVCWQSIAKHHFCFVTIIIFTIFHHIFQFALFSSQIILVRTTIHQFITASNSPLHVWHLCSANHRPTSTKIYLLCTVRCAFSVAAYIVVTCYLFLLLYCTYRQYGTWLIRAFRRNLFGA